MFNSLTYLLLCMLAISRSTTFAVPLGRAQDIAARSEDAIYSRDFEGFEFFTRDTTNPPPIPPKPHHLKNRQSQHVRTQAPIEKQESVTPRDYEQYDLFARGGGPAPPVPAKPHHLKGKPVPKSSVPYPVGVYELP